MDAKTAAGIERIKQELAAVGARTDAEKVAWLQAHIAATKVETAILRAENARILTEIQRAAVRVEQGHCWCCDRILNTLASIRYGACADCREGGCYPGHIACAKEAR
jgi:hypothetical protein